MIVSSAFVTLDGKGRVTLPEDVRAALGIGDGDFIILERNERGTFELVPAALVPKDQLWFYHPEMRRRIRKAEAGLAAGRVTRTRTLEEATTFLDSLKKRRRRKRVS
jgi:AbrB family looped-hinge helix DNA binding protein